MIFNHLLHISNCKNTLMLKRTDLKEMLCASPPSHKILHTQDGKNCIPPLSGTRSWENILLVHCLLSLYLFQTGGKKRHAFKVMGKCDFQALPIHVYGWSSRGERRCCCFSCWFLPAAGKERGGPRGTEPQEMSGYLLRGCFPPSCNGVRNIEKLCISKHKVHFMIT